MRSLILKPLYSRALVGLPLLGTPVETAARVLARPGTLHDRAREMASVHIALCTSTGFVCGLGGFLTLPVTLPANVVGVALVQLHLCASTAFLGAHDPADPAVRAKIFACMTGSVDPGIERDEAQEVADRSAVKVAERGIRLLAELTAGAFEVAGKFTINQAFRRRVARRSLPLVGGVIGGTSDLYSTQRVAEAARMAFLPPESLPDRQLAVAGDALDPST